MNRPIDAAGQAQSESSLRSALCAAGHSLFERGLAPGSSGNLSVRLDDGWLLTPTNACLGHLDPQRLARLDAQGQQVGGDAATKEAFLHLAMYRSRPQARAIVHLHSSHAAAVSCLADLDANDCIPPLTPYFVMKIGRLPLVPYHRPGDPALAAEVGRLAVRHTAVLLANHGPVVAGSSLEAALYATEELEETAKLFLMLHGRAVRTLDAAQLAELKQVFKLAD